jgi:hypothetical protein
MSSTDTTISARHAEIARRYDRHDTAQRVQRRPRYSVAALRLGELYRLMRHRWGHEIPDEADGARVFIRVVANTLAALVGDPADRIRKKIDLLAPWLDEDEVDEIVELAELSMTRYTADSVALAVDLDLATRKLLKIRTIGAVDCPADYRLEIRRRKHRDREAKRRAKKRAAARPKINLTELRPGSRRLFARDVLPAPSGI